MLFPASYATGCKEDAARVIISLLFKPVSVSTGPPLTGFTCTRLVLFLALLEALPDNNLSLDVSSFSSLFFLVIRARTAAGIFPNLLPNLDNNPSLRNLFGIISVPCSLCSSLTACLSARLVLLLCASRIALALV